ncbi:FAD-binding oxidoreductase [Ramlibacter sp. WS9]|uniref:NAD(P)/FAD-dependent oxidoreductase n=1 Tax=Ramlibacter sp. WS9 TaxID=1882741 RepID=UPI00114200A3|nr:FAD-dependent oxidoreductase [Ramlibacter sp. WS9]ROZ79449.1 FAD-binding oxidoreductase [Ramlibacter sp. WS9]
MLTCDVIVIGGGLVGTAVAYGLAQPGKNITVLDEGDDAFRASRGNFGLIWVHGKGRGFPQYARWTRESARQWPLLAARLQDETGIDVQAKQAGAFTLCFSEAELEARSERLAAVRDEAGGDYPYEILDRAALLQRLPHIGPTVFGGSYSPMDGHVNPLKLLRALHSACTQQDVTLKTGHGVQRITYADGLFTAHSGGRQFRAPKLVLAAGLGNAVLAGQVGLHAPVRPNRGQLIITERCKKILDYPTGHIRQTDEGGIQIGESMEDAGFDDGTTNKTLAELSRRAIASFPAIGQLNVVRVWGALRVMTPDGYPIYQESKSCPGAYVVTCHSGVTLAAAHAFRIAPWINGAGAPEELDAFTGDRFPIADASAQVLDHHHAH